MFTSVEPSLVELQHHSLSAPQQGFTLIELMVTLVITAILAALGQQAYSAYVDDARQSRMIGDIKLIETHIARFRTDTGGLPAALAELGVQVPDDPYGNPYRYLNIADAGPADKAKIRKDKNLHPLNSDYDLYSHGADGDSKPPLTAKVSRDDIIRAGNGGFLGIASDH